MLRGPRGRKIHHAFFTLAWNYCRRSGRSSSVIADGCLTQEMAVPRLILTPSTNPSAATPADPLLVFIQQAQLALVYSSRR